MASTTNAAKRRKTCTATDMPSAVKDGDAVLEGLPTKEQAKLRAAYAAVDAHVKDGQVVGIGSGSTIVYAVQRLAEKVRKDKISVVCIPTSFQAIQLINDNGLVLTDLAHHPEIDVAIDGADEISSQLDCIKGGGGCHVQEKIVAACAKTFIVVADFTKRADVLGTRWTKGVPIEVLSLCYVPIQNKLAAMGATPTLRMAQSKAGPVVTDNGHFILDAVFGPLAGTNAPDVLEKTLALMPGVVGSGLFVGMAAEAYLGTQDGGVVRLAL